MCKRSIYLAPCGAYMIKSLLVGCAKPLYISLARRVPSDAAHVPHSFIGIISGLFDGVPYLGYFRRRTSFEIHRKRPLPYRCSASKRNRIKGTIQGEVKITIMS